MDRNIAITLTLVAKHISGRILLHIYPPIDNKSFNFLILIVLGIIFLSGRGITKEDNGNVRLLYWHDCERTIISRFSTFSFFQKFSYLIYII